MMNVVHRSGNETIEGQKRFEYITVFEAPNQVKIANLSQTIDTTAGSIVSGENQIYFMDKNEFVYGVIQGNVETDGSVVTALTTRRNGGSWSSLTINSKTDGTTYATAPTPSSTSNTNQIATTAWVNTRLPKITYW